MEVDASVRMSMAVEVNEPTTMLMEVEVVSSVTVIVVVEVSVWMTVSGDVEGPGPDPESTYVEIDRPVVGTINGGDHGLCRRRELAPGECRDLCHL